MLEVDLGAGVKISPPLQNSPTLKGQTKNRVPDCHV